MIAHNKEIGQYAGFASRLIAFFLDLLLVSVAVAGSAVLASLALGLFGLDLSACPSSTGLVSGLWSLICQGTRLGLVVFSFVAAPLYWAFLTSWMGQTIGKRTMGLLVMRDDGRRLGFFRALARFLFYFVSMLTLGLGFLWILFDRGRRGFHDHLADTCVVYAWDVQQDPSFLWGIRHRLLPSTVPAEKPGEDLSLPLAAQTALASDGKSTEAFRAAMAQALTPESVADLLARNPELRAAVAQRAVAISAAGRETPVPPPPASD
jgi:uncharacterized RDD family membrane protein YckC